MVDLLAQVEGPKNIPQGRQRPSRSAPSATLAVFLSYGSEDHRKVHRLYKKLSREADLRPWLDRTNLEAGDLWEEKIDSAIQKSDALVVCLSSRSVQKIGFFQSEIRRIVKIADKQPEGTTSVWPAKLEPCETPRRLSRWQYVELFRRGGYEKLVSGLRKRAQFLATVRFGQKRATRHRLA
jgi:hypothetical protein